MSITKKTTTPTTFGNELNALMYKHKFSLEMFVEKKDLLSFRTTLKKYRKFYIDLMGMDGKGFTIYDMLTEFGYHITDTKPSERERDILKLTAFVDSKEKFTEADFKKIRYLCKKINPELSPRRTLKRLNLKDVYKYRL